MRTRKIALIASLTAVALTIFVIEAQIPPVVPIPGIKMGLANVITLFAVMTLGRKDAFVILLLRILLGSIFAGSVMSLMYSLAGGVICFLLMSAAVCIMNENMTWCISVIGAIGHNIGQIAVAVFVTHTVQIAWYLPVLMISAVITGLFTGLLTQMLLKHGNGIIRKILDVKK